MEALQCCPLGGGFRHCILRKVCHLTSVHWADDVRITCKECVSLAEAGWDVHLVAQGDLPSGFDGVTHHRLPPPPPRRFQRMVGATQRVYRLAKKVDAGIYHFHDPELMPLGLLLKLHGKKIVYDVHEDLPRDILTKTWIPRFLRRILAGLMNIAEHIASAIFDGVITATPTIAERFTSSKAVCVRNFPRLSEFKVVPRAACHSQRQSFVYIGLISHTRGLKNMLQAAAMIGKKNGALMKLELAGPVDRIDIRAAIHSSNADDLVRYHGCLDRIGIAQLLANALAGMVVLHPMPTFRHSLPIKLFEYMAAGLPVIASDFPLWRKIIDEARCGLLVNPLDTKKIAEAMQWILDHPDEARSMGQRGRDIVQQKFNWENEASELLNFYERLAGAGS
jgi:glycosyltransferase involved in cell wall biosynthesis